MLKKKIVGHPGACRSRFRLDTWDNRWLVLGSMVVFAGLADAQNTSLFHQEPGSGVVSSPQIPAAELPPPSAQHAPPTSVPNGRLPERNPGLERVSWTYSPPLPHRVFRKQDIVTIRVDEIARVIAEGNSESRKNAQFSAVLSEWIRLTRGRLRPDAQAEGDPTVAGQTNSQYRAEAEVESREALTFNIAARIVDIRPNGNLVVEARKQFRVNDNIWETSLSGICRAQDVAPDNVVLSRDMIDLQINKQDQGHMRDGYKRGWFARMFDRFQPF